MIGGFLMFAALCGVGAIANINVANVLYHSQQRLGARRVSRAR